MTSNINSVRIYAMAPSDVIEECAERIDIRPYLARVTLGRDYDERKIGFSLDLLR
jgi:hypothetical protein